MIDVVVTRYISASPRQQEFRHITMGAMVMRVVRMPEHAASGITHLRVEGSANMVPIEHRVFVEKTGVVSLEARPIHRYVEGWYLDGTEDAVVACETAVDLEVMNHLADGWSRARTGEDEE